MAAPAHTQLSPERLLQRAVQAGWIGATASCADVGARTVIPAAGNAILREARSQAAGCEGGSALPTPTGEHDALPVEVVPPRQALLEILDKLRARAQIAGNGEPGGPKCLEHIDVDST